MRIRKICEQIFYFFTKRIDSETVTVDVKEIWCFNDSIDRDFDAGFRFRAGSGSRLTL